MSRRHAAEGRPGAFLASLVCLVCLVFPTGEAARAAEAAAGDHAVGSRAAPGIAIPERATPTLGVDALERGMKGYGMTVFAGGEPEPFAFEVVAVIRRSSPGRAVIWVECTDPRLVESGPVQGMSGSPMYVWDDAGAAAADRTPGEGGKLIGAFAFGYAFSKRCYVGVQPIRYMRELTDAATGDPAAAATAATRQAPPRHARRTLDTLRGFDGLTGLTRARLDLARRLLPGDEGEHDAHPTPATPGPFGERDARALRLPLDLGSPQLAQLAAPLLEPYGLAPVAGGQTGTPAPASLQHGGGHGNADDPDAPDAAPPTIKPGAALAVPLIMGDWDAAAAGTVTDVLPDGGVLGFGHPMMNGGDTALPLATGVVHFVMPSLQISFKQSSRRDVVGTLRRDAAAGVAGGPGVDFQTARVHVRVDQAGVEPRDYRYDVVELPGMTPTFAAIAALQSLTAVQSSPLENTTRLRATMRFDTGHALELDTLVPLAQPQSLVGDLLMPMAMMTTSGFKPARLTELDVRFDVTPEVRQAVIADATLASAVVAPGEALEITARLQPYNQPLRTETLTLRVPPDVPEGDYVLTVGDAQTYLGMTLGSRPHLVNPGSLDDLAAVLQRMIGVDNDRLYAVMQLNNQAVAVGQSELPRLPSSRAAMIATPASTRATLYRETIEVSRSLDLVPTGNRMFMLSVRDPAGAARTGGEP